MKNYFSISEAAKMAGMTSETLRHYDRIGLVKPGKRDEWTGYRYYSKEDIIRLSTIQALRYMDLSLAEIKRVLQLDNLEEVVAFLRQAEQQADDKIAKLQYAKKKIRTARSDYEKKLHGMTEIAEITKIHFSERVILLSDTLEYPTLDNLWNYLSHFYDQIDEADRDDYAFEDMAGIYTKDGRSRLFAVCLHYPDRDGLTVLPAGTYLCADCTEDGREQALARLKRAAAECGAHMDFLVQTIVITGILQWNYQLQILLKPDAVRPSK